MCTTHRTPSSARRGVTLVELLIVMAILAGLAAMLVAIIPTLQDSQRVSKAADVVQGQLFVARQMALRDQQPRGIRLVATGTFTQAVVVNNVTTQVPLFDQLQLIEQPAAYTTGVVPTQKIITTPTSTWPQDPTTGWFIVPFNPDPITGADPTADLASGVVLPGDLLDLAPASDAYTVTSPPTPGSMHLIMAVNLVVPNAPLPNVAVLTQPQIKYTGSPFPSYYRIIRSPRPLTGEAAVTLPKGIIVDAASGNYPSTRTAPIFPQFPKATITVGSLMVPDTDGNFEVLFDPSGKVLRASGSQGKVVLWVRDADVNPTTTNRLSTDQTLVTVYTRTGLITAQPVNFTNNSGRPNTFPYDFVVDGATSGM